MYKVFVSKCHLTHKDLYTDSIKNPLPPSRLIHFKPYVQKEDKLKDCGS